MLQPSSMKISIKITMNYLDIRVFYLQDVGDVEWSMTCMAELVHLLGVDIPRGGHDQHVLGLLCEHKCDVTDLPTANRKMSQ